MANVKVSVSENLVGPVRREAPSSVVSAAEDIAGPISVVDPALVVTMIEGFMAILRVADLVDVDVTNLENGSVLVWNSTSETWVAQRNLDLQIIDSGRF